MIQLNQDETDLVCWYFLQL